MKLTLILCLAPFLKGPAAVAQERSPDAQITQSLLTEIHQLRLELQNSAATVQIVQIAIYRLEAQSAILDRARQALEDVRTHCKQQEAQRKMVTDQIEEAEAQKRDSQNPSGQKAAEELLAALKLSIRSSDEGPQCQAEQMNAETRFHTEQARMNELQDRLDQIDRDLAGHAGR